MLFMNKFTKRLNLNICPITYDKINEVATQQGRKTGSMARLILQEWAMTMKEQLNDRSEKNIGN